jgi:N-acetylmuramoyl-L-alanine amidase
MRASLANKEKCEQFISIHCNSFAEPHVGGTETWYHAGSAQGERLARSVQESLVRVGQLENRGVKETKSLAVLRYTTMPAILIELAFISNSEEEKLLQDGWWLSQAMSAISHALTGGKADQVTEEAELVRLFRLLDQVERDRVLALLVDMVESKGKNPA